MKIDSIFIVLENDNYGEALYIGIAYTKEEAEILVNRDDTRYFIEHQLDYEKS